MREQIVDLTWDEIEEEMHGSWLERALTLSRLILEFGQVMRITEDAEGRLESDTTHTVMLALLAGEMAAHETVPLDREAVVCMALVHDLVEVRAGDTATLRELSAEARADKESREAAGLVWLRSELAGFPWLLAWLDRYEAQACLESRFVKYLDKVLPNLTHRDNGCRVPKREGMTLEEFMARHHQQQAELARKYPQFLGVQRLLEAACRDSERQW